MTRPLPPGRLCPCGLDPRIWQNPWNHEADCSMQPTASEPTDELRWVHERIGQAELDRLRASLSREDRDSLTAWEVVEIAADTLADLLAKLQAVEALAEELGAPIVGGPCAGQTPLYGGGDVSYRLRRALDGER